MCIVASSGIISPDVEGYMMTAPSSQDLVDTRTDSDSVAAALRAGDNSISLNRFGSKGLSCAPKIRLLMSCLTLRIISYIYLYDGYEFENRPSLSLCH